MVNYIWVTTQREGYHFWKNAVKEVEFLKHPHRHMFQFKVYVEIKNHNDREIEFIILKRNVTQYIKILFERYGLDTTKGAGMSCEMISDELQGLLEGPYPERKMIIEVSEDGENGSRKEYK